MYTGRVGPPVSKRNYIVALLAALGFVLLFVNYFVYNHSDSPSLIAKVEELTQKVESQAQNSLTEIQLQTLLDQAIIAISNHESDSVSVILDKLRSFQQLHSDGLEAVRESMERGFGRIEAQQETVIEHVLATQTSPKQSPWQKVAVVTYFHKGDTAGRAFALQVMRVCALMTSVSMTLETKRDVDLVVMVDRATTSEGVMSIFRDLGCEVIPVESLAISQEVIDVIPKNQPNWKYTFSKHRAFDLVQYQKIVFLDSDTLVTRNMDEMFDIPSVSMLANYWYGTKYNSGVIVLEPDERVCELFPAYIDDHFSPPEDGVMSINDQSFIEILDEMTTTYFLCNTTENMNCIYHHLIWVVEDNCDWDKGTAVANTIVWHFTTGWMFESMLEYSAWQGQGICRNWIYNLWKAYNSFAQEKLQYNEEFRKLFPQ